MKRYILGLCTWYCLITLHVINAQYTRRPSIAMGRPHHTWVDEDDVESLSQDEAWRKVKKIDRLCVKCLNVTKHLCVNGQEITGTSQTGTLSPSYGQLSVTDQDIAFFTDNTWLAIPFNATGPSSNIGISTTSPATITIAQDGVYQINVSLYFSVETSDEDTFTVTTYTLGLTINGVTTPVAAVYVGELGTFSLNYSGLVDLAANDQIQLYMQASDTDGPPFANNVTLENGNAHVLHIAN